MKAYVVTVSFTGSSPRIWRQVIMPAGATFNRLHDIIQAVTNFESGHGFAYHLYRFELPDEHLIITNDDQVREEHLHFMKNRDTYRMRLEKLPEEMREYELARQAELQKTAKSPVRVKIDTYLEKYGRLDYLYDFGDDWGLAVELEKTVYDYPFGYPTLIDGDQTAPPEDVGGLPGFYEFLRAISDPSHPDHEELRVWYEGLSALEFDRESINDRLRTVKYRKNEPVD